MKVQCPYCESTYEITEDKCPGCGAPNENALAGTRVVKDPATIEELQEWYKKRNLPPEDVTRFFIGKDYKGPKAFGIYRDGKKVIVYKNKADGSRAVRYEGPDEAVAVREILVKLKETIKEQKAANNAKKQTSNNNRNNSGRNRQKRRGDSSVSWGIGIFIAVFVALFVMGAASPDRGYYKYKNDTYYYLNDWYKYDSALDDWTRTSDPFTDGEKARDYYESRALPEDADAWDFEDTDFYSDWEEEQASHSSDYDDDDDDDYNWGSDDSWDSWDSGGTDWDSDW